jgi:hypothetical protein
VREKREGEKRWRTASRSPYTIEQSFGQFGADEAFDIELRTTVTPYSRVLYTFWVA